MVFAGASEESLSEIIDRRTAAQLRALHRTRTGALLYSESYTLSRRRSAPVSFKRWAADSMAVPPNIITFAHDRPFFTMVTSFLVSAVGLGPVFDRANPLGLDRQTAAFFAGKVQPTVAIDMQQIRDMASFIGSDVALRSLCCMLVNTAYESVKTRDDHSPEFEVFRHARNAASHSNKFVFHPNEPSRPARWRNLTIDHSLKGAANPLHGTDCFGGLFAPADAILLLSDIERKLT